MEVKAKAKFVRFSPRKARLVADLVRGLSLAEALARLSLMKQQAAKPIAKLLKSAAANADHNFKLATEKLFVKAIVVDNGPVYKRFTPRAFGRAAPIRHRTSHISLVLVEKETPAAKKKDKKDKKDKKNP
jgi:large subunit ribosomal protein L22